MKRLFILLWAVALTPIALASEMPRPHWTAAQAARLIEWLKAADDDGLGSISPQADLVQAALDRGDPTVLDDAATAAATRLVEAHRHGCCNASLRTGWHIAEANEWDDVSEAIEAAVDANAIDTLFGYTRPSHPFYYSLRQAYAAERDPVRRATLAANLDRWRWMPRAMGRRYLLVNAAAFEATLWQDQEMIGRWRVVVGKTRSPTPIFSAAVTGVILNPWWEIPSNIAAEGVANMVRNRPAEAAAKGYVFQDGRYRQRPGPGNALGRMKLIMPNGYRVYLHDTPSRSLFDQDIRAYSHGCVRVGDALGLVTALLSPQDGWDRARVDAAVTTGRTQAISLQTALPVYIAYFTAEPDGEGGIRYFPDIYHRDNGARSTGDDGQCAR